MTDAFDHRGMVFLVRENDGARQELLQRRQRGVVGDIGRGKQQRGFFAVQISDLGFELDVVVRGTGNVARAARARAGRIEGFVHGGDDGRMLAHAEIVV